MHVERMLALAEHLEKNVKDGEFRIWEWRCGTAACAGGHACDVPLLRDAGLKLENFGSWSHITSLRPCYQDKVGYEAMAALFEITEDQSWDIFAPASYKDGADGRLDVAWRIRKMVAENQEKR